MKKLPPCKGCEERFPGCHADCERYKNWKTEHQARMEEKYAAKKLDESTISERSQRKHWQNSRYRNRKYLK